MKNLRFVIIDNMPVHIYEARRLLTEIGADSDRIWPSDKNISLSILEQWETVFETLLNLKATGWNPDSDCVIALLDLALDKENKNAMEGEEQIKRHINGILRPYVTVVLSQSGAQAAAAGLDEMVDRVLDRRDIQQVDRSKSRNNMERAILAAIDAWKTRTKRNDSVSDDREPTVMLTDSPALRNAEAVMSTTTLKELAFRLVGPGTTVNISASDGGYSGTYLIRMDWFRDGSSHGLILKASREKKPLEDELAGWQKMATTYSAFVGLIPPLAEFSIQQAGLRNNSVWYLVQARISGPTLEEYLVDILSRHDGSTEFHSNGPLVDLFAKLVSKDRESMKLGLSTITPPSRFALREDDITRFFASVDLLLPIWDQCATMSEMTREIIETRGMVEPFQKLIISHWDQCLLANGLANLPAFYQHGDLNTRNIMFANQVTPQLIDFDSVDRWPAFYDLSQLEMHLALRLIDTKGLRDAFPDRISSWFSLWKAATDRRSASAPTPEVLDNGPSFCLFFQLVQRIGDGKRQLYNEYQHKLGAVSLSQLEQIVRVHQAIMMCTYQDATMFKRLLFLIIGIHEALQCGLLNTR